MNNIHTILNASLIQRQGDKLQTDIFNGLSSPETHNADRIEVNDHQSYRSRVGKMQLVECSF